MANPEISVLYAMQMDEDDSSEDFWYFTTEDLGPPAKRRRTGPSGGPAHPRPQLVQATAGAAPATSWSSSTGEASGRSGPSTRCTDRGRFAAGVVESTASGGPAPS